LDGAGTLRPRAGPESHRTRHWGERRIHRGLPRQGQYGLGSAVVFDL